MQSVGNDLPSNFFTFRFFIILIQRISSFIIIAIINMGLVTCGAIELIDIEFPVVFFFFFTSYYGAMIVTRCGYLYIIFSLMLGLGDNFGVFGRYTI